MPDHESPSPLISEIAEALKLLSNFKGSGSHAALTADPLPNLVAQCRTLLQSASAPQPVRLIHHFACSGGTIISKALAMQPGVVLLGEMDPLSPLRVSQNGKPPFAPSDIVLALQHAHRTIPQNVLIDSFIDGTLSAKRGIEAEGLHLVLRDHAHSHFCTGLDHQTRPTLHAMFAARAETLGIVTVRHPLESFISLAKNGWKHFQPFTLGEYARRYIAFLEAHEGLPIFTYERFSSAPEETVEQMADALVLRSSPLALHLLSIPRLSGDSGRSGNIIAPRPDKIPPPWISDHCDDPLYMELCQRLGYQPEPPRADEQT